MKFGDSLFQRSVPAWRRYNIDYGSVKKFIKEHTTPGSGKAVDIPGRGNAFEDDLFEFFVREHERVSLFVKSKLYEINSRLESVDRQLQRLQKPRLQTKALQNGISVRRKFSRVESEVVRVGEEIQNLARFISSNRLAMRKLLKKYKKWTGSSNLGHRVNDQILKPSDSFCNIDLAPPLNRYAEYLDATRLSFTVAPCQHEPPRSRPSSKMSKSAQDCWDTIMKLSQGSTMEFDTALSAPLLGQQSQCAVYWVHVDNLLELRVLLVQQLRSFKVGQGQTRKCLYAEREHVSEALVGDLDVLVRAHNETPRDNRDRLGLTQSGCAVAKWCSSGSTALIMFPTESGTDGTFEVARMRQSQLRSFADRNIALPSSDLAESSGEEGNPSGHSLTDLQAARLKFLSKYDAAPIVHASYKRSRFSGIGNSPSSGVWVSLDEDVKFAELTQDTLQTSGKLEPKVNFPYAVLTVRCESDGAELVSTLDRTHLTERVRGFSTLKHAVATCCKPIGMREPHWFTTLKKDIRHVPSTPTPLSRSNSSSNPGLSSGSKPTSRSTTSGSDGPMTPTGNQIINISNATDVKYWNEYDNPEEEQNSFYVYVNPDEPLFPGQHMMQRWGHQISAFFVKSQNDKDEHSPATNRSTATTTPQNEVSPLIDNESDAPSNSAIGFVPPSEDVTSSSDNDESIRRVLKRSKRAKVNGGSKRQLRSYGATSQPLPNATETLLLTRNIAPRHRSRSNIGVMFLSLVLSIMTLAIGIAVLLAGSVYRFRDPNALNINWFAVAAVIISLACAVVAIAEFCGFNFFFWRQDPPDSRALLIAPETGNVFTESGQTATAGNDTNDRVEHGIIATLSMTLYGLVIFVGNVLVLTGAFEGA